MVFGKFITVHGKGFSDIRDITADVQDIVQESGIQNGLVNVFPAGSTASVTTIEYEPALVEDMKDQLEAFASRTMKSRHSETWGDDNGFSHIRASFMGPGLTAPVSEDRPPVWGWSEDGPACERRAIFFRARTVSRPKHTRRFTKYKR